MILSEQSSLQIAICPKRSSTCCLSRRLFLSVGEGRQRSCVIAFKERDLPGHYEQEGNFGEPLTDLRVYRTI